MSSIEKKAIDNKDIKKIELTYETHCCIDLDELFNPEDGETNPFAEGRVIGWWIKYDRITIALDDDTVIRRDISWWLGDTLENLDTKWPKYIMLEDEDGRWYRKGMFE